MSEIANAARKAAQKTTPYTSVKNILAAIPDGIITLNGAFLKDMIDKTQKDEYGQPVVLENVVCFTFAESAEKCLPMSKSDLKIFADAMLKEYDDDIDRLDDALKVANQVVQLGKMALSNGGQKNTIRWVKEIIIGNIDGETGEVLDEK